MDSQDSISVQQSISPDLALWLGHPVTVALKAYLEHRVASQVDHLLGENLLAYREGFDREYAATVREIRVLRELAQFDIKEWFDCVRG